MNNSRLQSLDILRGIIMLLLAGEACGLYENLSETAFPKIVINQFFHHDWHGLLFWDLVQPAFMTMAGTALYLSWQKVKSQGITWSANAKKVIIRCVKLLACGVGLHCIYKGRLTWELWNVLSQLSFTTLVAYLIIEKNYKTQAFISFGILVISFIAYNLIKTTEFNEPYTIGKNLGSLTDMLLMGQINKGGWVAINCIPTSAHTIWGVLLGKWITEEKPKIEKLRWIIYCGIGLVLAGYVLDIAGIPIIKRICTASFVIVSGGWVLLFFALTYWLTDILGWKKYNLIPIVIGMNSIFIYLVFETIGHQWLNKTIGIFTLGITDAISIPHTVGAVINSIVVLVFLWSLCHFLYRRNIFFKL